MIWVKRSGRLVIGGFTSARESTAAKMTENGNLQYSAPEVIEDILHLGQRKKEEIGQKDYGPECDVFSVGLILYEMLAGQPFFPEDNNDRTRLIAKIDGIKDNGLGKDIDNKN